MRVRPPPPWLLGPALAMAAIGTANAVPTDYRPPVDYALRCQGCHLPDGSGSPGKVPDLRNMLGKFVAVPGGRDYLVRVPGTATSKLNDRQVAALLNWLVPAMGPPPPAGFKPYTAEEVGRLRANRLKQVEPMRTNLLRAIARLPR